MHDLPHNLIEAFKATLEEVESADLLLHVVDISNPRHPYLKESVDKVLAELKALDKPTILVLNKIDRMEDKDLVDMACRKYKNAVAISGLKGEKIDALLKLIQKELSGRVMLVDVSIPISRMDLVNRVHRQGNVVAIEYVADVIHIKAAVPHHLAGLLEQVAVLKK